MIRALFLSMFFLCACSEANKTPLPADTFFEMSIAGKTFHAQLAISDFEKSKGLMYRKSLGEDEAMIFVYTNPQQMSFWMKNTFINLDLAFFNKDGKLLEIKSLYAHKLDSVRSASHDVLYCMESNESWFEKNKIKVGDSLDLTLLNKAIVKRK